MDSSSIGALTGTTDTSKKKKSTSSPGDADAFASAMGEADKGEGSDKADLISKEKSSKEKEADKADAKKREAEQADKQSAKKEDVKHKKGGKIDDYLQNIKSKDPAALSMAERQAFRVGEFASGAKKPRSGVMQMLQGQGIDMSSFSPQQIMSLLSRFDTKELGKMMSQMKALGVKVDDETIAQLKEQMNNAQNNNNVKEPAGNFNIQDFAAAGMPKEAGESARAEQRRAVMDQLLTKIQVRNVANQTEMQLRLNPEYLGEVKISLLHDKEGGVKATFQTTSKLTKEILAENKDELMEKARTNGVRIGDMDVEFVDELTA